MSDRREPRATATGSLLFFACALISAAQSFENVAPVFEKNCLSCHAAGALKEFPPADLYKSVLDGKMPPGSSLPNREIRAIQQWVASGAPWPEGAALTRSAAPTNSNEREIVRKIREKLLARRESNERHVTIPGTVVSFDMVPIPAGSFEMGSRTVHLDAFWMQAHEVTWDEYRLFMFANGDDSVDGISHPTRPYVEMSFGMGINGYPAISMTQHAANKYAEWLSARTGEFYRLPTEAEWEYACRAGGFRYEPLGDYAWSVENSKGTYQKVASKKPNPWGLFDMLGNVMEWTLDQLEPYSPGEQTNPWVPAKSPYPQAVRGGSWHDPASACACTARVGSSPAWKRQDPQLPKSIWYHTDAQWLGFRLVRVAKIPSVDELYRYWNNGVEHDEQ